MRDLAADASFERAEEATPAELVVDAAAPPEAEVVQKTAALQCSRQRIIEATRFSA
jgi:hypothetical protein